MTVGRTVGAMLAGARADRGDERSRPQDGLLAALTRCSAAGRASTVGMQHALVRTAAPCPRRIARVTELAGESQATIFADELCLRTQVRQ